MTLARQRLPLLPFATHAEGSALCRPHSSSRLCIERAPSCATCLSVSSMLAMTPTLPNGRCGASPPCPMPVWLSPLHSQRCPSMPQTVLPRRHPPPRSRNLHRRPSINAGPVHHGSGPRILCEVKVWEYFLPTASYASNCVMFWCTQPRSRCCYCSSSYRQFS